MLLLFFKFFEKKFFWKRYIDFCQGTIWGTCQKNGPDKKLSCAFKTFFCQKYQFSPKIKVFSGDINQNLELKKNTASCTRPSNTQWPSEVLSPVIPAGKDVLFLVVLTCALGSTW